MRSASKATHFQAMSAENFAKIHKIVTEIPCLQKLATHRQTNTVHNQTPG